VVEFHQTRFELDVWDRNLGSGREPGKVPSDRGYRYLMATILSIQVLSWVGHKMLGELLEAHATCLLDVLVCVRWRLVEFGGWA